MRPGQNRLGYLCDHRRGRPPQASFSPMSATPAELEEYKKRHKAPLWGTFSVSLLVHVIVIGLLGSVVVFRVFERPAAQFAPPPPPAPPRLDPRKLEHQV